MKIVQAVVDRVESCVEGVQYKASVRFAVHTDCLEEAFALVGALPRLLRKQELTNIGVPPSAFSDAAVQEIVREYTAQEKSRPEEERDGAIVGCSSSDLVSCAAAVHADPSSAVHCQRGASQTTTSVVEDTVRTADGSAEAPAAKQAEDLAVAPASQYADMFKAAQEQGTVKRRQRRKVEPVEEPAAMEALLSASVARVTEEKVEKFITSMSESMSAVVPEAPVQVPPPPPPPPPPAVQCAVTLDPKLFEKLRSLKDVVDLLRQKGVETNVDAMVAACEQLRAGVPIIGKIPNLQERVGRALDILGFGLEQAPF